MLGKAGSSKNMKKFLCFISGHLLGMGAGVVYMKSSEDNEGPKITLKKERYELYIRYDRRGSSEGCKGTG